MKTINLFYKILLCSLALSIICSCATDVANRYYLDKPLPPSTPENVELLFSKPDREFIVIADFQSRGKTPESMRIEAAKVGADAVIVSEVGGYFFTSEEWAGEGKSGISSPYTRNIGTAIKYK